MADFYIATTSGSDVTGDGSQGNPWQTIEHVHTNSSLGDTIYLSEAGRYQVTPGNNTDISGRTWIGIQQNHWRKHLDVIVDLSNHITGTSSVMFNLSPNPTTFKWIQFSDCINTNSRFVTFDIVEQEATFEDCRFFDNRVGSQFSVGDGFFAYEYGDLYLTRCYFSGFNNNSNDDGAFISIFRKPTALESEIVIDRCLFDVNGDDNPMKSILETGASGDLSLTNITIKNSIFVNNVLYSITFPTTSRMDEPGTNIGAGSFVDNCIIYNKKSIMYFISNEWEAVSTNINYEDPLFIDYLNGDYRLNTNSPAFGSRG